MPLRADVAYGPSGNLAGRRHEHERILEQQHRLQLAGTQPDGEGHVELAGDHGVRPGVDVLVLQQADVEVRVLAAEPADDRRQQHVGHALERADVEPAGCSGEEAVDRIAGGVDPGDDVSGVGEHDLAERGQRHRARPTRAVEQRAADDPFEGRDLLADRRLGVAEAGRRPAERALRGDGVEGDEVAELEVAEQWHDDQRS